MMTILERSQAAAALIAWFKSQDIDPADAAMIMSSVLAEQLVLKAKGDIDKLQIAANGMNKLLILDIADWLRK